MMLNRTELRLRPSGMIRSWAKGRTVPASRPSRAFFSIAVLQRAQFDSLAFQGGVHDVGFSADRAGD